LKGDLISLTIKAGQSSDGQKGIDPKVTDKELEVGRRAVMVGYATTIVAPIMVVLTSIAVIPLIIKETEVQKINENLRRKAFVDRTVYPGESHFGFVYFPVTNRETLRDAEALTIKAKELSSDKELKFVFQIKE
jgi:hypothetical protein